MAFHQPLVPVLPVARELLAKTKWTASSKVQPHDSPLRLLHPSRMLVTDDDQRLNWTLNERKSEISAKSSWRQVLRSNKDSPKLTSLPLTDEPEAMDTDQPSGANERRTGRKRVKSLFSKRNSSKSKGPEKVWVVVSVLSQASKMFFFFAAPVRRYSQSKAIARAICITSNDLCSKISLATSCNRSVVYLDIYS